MVAKIKLKLEKDALGFHIDGKREFDFQAGVEYVVEADEDIWVTWHDDTSHLNTYTTKQGDVLLHNLTCVDHHRYSSDALLYYIRFKNLVDLEGIPIGLWDKEIETVIPNTDILQDDVSAYIGNQVLPSRTFNLNGTFAEMFALEQEDHLQSTPHVFPISNLTERYYVFEDSERYLAVLKDGARVDPRKYKASFVANGNFHKIDLVENIKTVQVISDLCHNVRDNGSRTIKIIVREGDERRFYMNTYNKKYTNFVGRGLKSPDNLVHVRNLFDDYVQTNFPQLVEFIKSYYSYENLTGSASSFIRNMDDYYDVDKMSDEMLRDKIKTVLPAVDSFQVDKRILAKRMLDFFKRKGTLPSFKWLTNAMFKKDVTIKRFSDDVIKLSDSDVSVRLCFYLDQRDIVRMEANGDVLTLAIEYENTDDIAYGLTGFQIQGRNSNAFAVIENVEKVYRQTLPFYKISCDVKNGTFSDNEPLDIRILTGNVNINQLTAASRRRGIIDVEIVDGSFGYQLGATISGVSNTGEGFEATVASVDSKGSIKRVVIDDSGWFYRRYADGVDILNDFKVARIPFNPSRLINARLIRDEGVGYTFLDGNIVPIEIVGTNLLVNKKWEINRGSYMFNYPIASSRWRRNIVFFGKSLNNRQVYIVDEDDRARTLNVEFISDIVSLHATDRTLFVVTNSGLTTVSIESIYSKKPEYKEIQIASPSGFVRTVFSIGSQLYGLTDTNVLRISPAGVVTAVYPIDRVYDLAVYKRVGRTHTLYLGRYGNLYAYQWYNGEQKAVLKPKFGSFYEVYDTDGERKHGLSGSSKMNDNDVYQDFSIAIDLDETTDAYMENFKSLVTPAGYKVFGLKRNEAKPARLGKAYTESTGSTI